MAADLRALQAALDKLQRIAGQEEPYVLQLESKLRAGQNPKQLKRFPELDPQALQLLEDFNTNYDNLREYFPIDWIYAGVTPEIMHIFLSGLGQNAFDCISKRQLIEEALKYNSQDHASFKAIQQTIDMLEIYGTVVKYLDQIKLHELAAAFLKHNAEAAAALEACKLNSGNRDKLDQLIREAVKIIAPIAWKELNCANFLTPLPAGLSFNNPNFYKFLSAEDIDDFHKSFPKGVSEEQRKAVFEEALFRRLHRYIFRKVTAHSLHKAEDKPYTSRVFPLTFPTPKDLKEIEAALALAAKQKEPALVLFSPSASASVTSASASSSASISAASSNSSSPSSFSAVVLTAPMITISSASPRVSNKNASSAIESFLNYAALSTSSEAEASSSSTTSSRLPVSRSYGADASLGIAAEPAKKKFS